MIRVQISQPPQEDMPLNVLSVALAVWSGRGFTFVMFVSGESYQSVHLSSVRERIRLDQRRRRVGRRRVRQYDGSENALSVLRKRHAENHLLRARRTDRFHNVVSKDGRQRVRASGRIKLLETGLVWKNGHASGENHVSTVGLLVLSVHIFLVSQYPFKCCGII